MVVVFMWIELNICFNLFEKVTILNMFDPLSRPLSDSFYF